MKSTPCLLLLALLAAVGCNRAPEAPKATANDAHAMMQAELEKASMNFAKVIVVRLQQDGKRLEVSSVAPAVVAETSVGGLTAKTIFRISDNSEALTLFSRDLRNGKSFRTELALAQLETKRQFSFPVVQADGSLRELSFAVERIVAPQ